VAVKVVCAGTMVAHRVDAGQATLVSLLVALIAACFLVGCVPCHAAVMRCEAA
jgi:hypothetical protein